MKKNEKTAVIYVFSQIKKKVTVLSSMMIFLLSATSYAVVFEPEWTEFCPPKYCESNENVFSQDATYWYKRRLQFQRSLKRCSEFKGKELDSCYEEIRAAESRKNKVWDVRQDEKFRTTEYNREYYMEKMKYDSINHMLETIKK